MRIIIGAGIQTMRLIIGPTNRGCPPTTPIGGRTHWVMVTRTQMVIVMRTHWVIVTRPPSIIVRRPLNASA